MGTPSQLAQSRPPPGAQKHPCLSGGDSQHVLDVGLEHQHECRGVVLDMVADLVDLPEGFQADHVAAAANQVSGVRGPPALANE